MAAWACDRFLCFTEQSVDDYTWLASSFYVFCKLCFYISQISAQEWNNCRGRCLVNIKRGEVLKVTLSLLSLLGTKHRSISHCFLMPSPVRAHSRDSV